MLSSHAPLHANHIVTHFAGRENSTARLRYMDDTFQGNLAAIMSTVEQIIGVAVVIHVMALAYFVYSGLVGSQKQKDQ